MPQITPDEAVAVARRYGLSLTDALALRGMAADLDEAESLASIFAAPFSREMDDAIRVAAERSTPKWDFG